MNKIGDGDYNVQGAPQTGKPPEIKEPKSEIQVVYSMNIFRPIGNFFKRAFKAVQQKGGDLVTQIGLRKLNAKTEEAGSKVKKEGERLATKEARVTRLEAKKSMYEVGKNRTAEITDTFEEKINPVRHPQKAFRKEMFERQKKKELEDIKAATEKYDALEVKLVKLTPQIEKLKQSQSNYEVLQTKYQLASDDVSDQIKFIKEQGFFTRRGMISKFKEVWPGRIESNSISQSIGFYTALREHDKENWVTDGIEEKMLSKLADPKENLLDVVDQLKALIKNGATSPEVRDAAKGALTKELVAEIVSGKRPDNYGDIVSSCGLDEKAIREGVQEGATKIIMDEMKDQIADMIRLKVNELFRAV